MAGLTWPEVEGEELCAIIRRREEEGIAQHVPLSGLAFSGGGIRSATFGLGVLEALRERDFLRRFDYVSSVSGGGYILSWLSANCVRWRERCRRANVAPTSWLAPDADWSDSIRHLSRYSNYLSPQVGFLSADTWSMLMVWIRNTTLVQALVIALIATLLLLPPFVPALFAYWAHAHHERWATIVLFVVAVVGVAANQLQLRHREPLWLRLGAARWHLGLLLAAVLVAATAWFWRAARFEPWQAGAISLAAFPIAGLIMLAALACVPLLQRLWRALGGAGEVNYGQLATQWAIVIPMLATAVLMSAVLWGVGTDGSAATAPLRAAGSYGELLVVAWRYWPFPLSFAFDSFVLFGISALQSWDRDKGLEALGRRWINVLVVPLAALVCAGLLHMMLCAVLLLIRYFDGLAGDVWHAFVWIPPLLMTMFAVCLTFLIGLLGRASVEGLREWWSRLGAWLCIYAFGWTAGAVAAVYGPFAVIWLLDYDRWQSIVPAAGWLLTTVGGLLAARSSRTAADDKIRSVAPTKTSQALQGLALLAPYVFLVGVFVLVAAALHVVMVLLAQGIGACQAALTDMSTYWVQADLPLRSRTAVLLAACGVLVLLAWRIDINEFGLNQFYRNRLVRCYLGATRQSGERTPQAFTQFDEQDDMAMTDLTHDAPGVRELDGPLHIVNCAMNLGGTRDLALHTRHSATFIVTPYVLGSAFFHRSVPGNRAYRAHDDFGDAGKPMTLGHAAAVSGAAASPNMGFHTSPIVAFMMTMFNARLGWWLPNPSKPARRRSSPWFSLRYLVMELFGAANERSNYLMVSDGGHFENLGVYELVRRECELIVAVDAECDRNMTFGALGTLVRMCKTDFDASIKIDVAKLVPDSATGMSSAQWAIGEIVYHRTGKCGILVYVKASLTGNEGDVSIRQYRANHADFPHESTGDQFYGEDQFESYRRLGRHIARSIAGAGMTKSQHQWLSEIWPGV